MKTRKLRLLSALLALAMLLALTPTAAFADEEGKFGIEFQANGNTYTMQYRILDESAQTVEVLGPPYANPPTVVIPGEVEHNGKKYKVVKIADYAFREGTRYWNQLKSITLPNTLQEIGSSAFLKCGALTSVNIPTDASVTTIGGSAFNGCKALTEISLPSTVTTIGDAAFMGCEALNEISLPSTVTTIGGSAFNGCKALTEINIPATVTTIGSYCFQNCEKLGTVTFDKESKLQTIEEATFQNCGALEKISIPSGVAKIGYIAFQGCGSLTEVAFAEESKLQAIGGRAFDGCTKLSSITIPATVTGISYNAFENCSSLTAVEIPAAVTGIGSKCFSGCTNLTSVKFAPNSKLSYVDENAFQNCNADLKIECDDKSIKDKLVAAGVSGNSVEVPKVNVTLDYNGGQDADGKTTATKELERGDTVQAVTAPTRTGYTFGGWYKNAECTSKLGANETITENMILYAGWNINQYRVTFDAQGGENAPDSQSVAYNTFASEPVAPTKAGYTFGGWYTQDAEGKYAAEAFDFENTLITEDTTVYAKWNINQYRVTFDAQGGEDELASQTVAYNTFASEPVAPTKAGYTFGGWYTQDAEGKYAAEAFDFENTPITADTTVYAKWLLNAAPLIPATPVTYKVTVENGTARVLDENGDALVKEGESVTVQVGKTVTLKAADFSDSNMKFDRWEVRKGEVKLANDHAAETTFTMPAGDVELEAMPVTADTDDSSWDTATVVTGVVLGTGTAVLAYHIGMEVYAEQVLGKGVAVPKTRADVALLAWQLAGKPEVAVEGEPLSEAAQAQKWAVESGLMQNDADGSFNPDKKMSKWKALRTLDAAKKMG